MTAISPRVDRRLLRAAELLDDPDEPFAETWRKVGLVADRLELTRPGYDTIRLVARDRRRGREDVRRLLQPVVSDALQGRWSMWDVERALEAVTVARSSLRSAR